ncbi:hypothetical protein DSO57_1002584 [Entomophthora muscae]|uniref:Uncharacterized protein n=1 Tax=Entomophthora muscae TaxID=34485 RepID=A0ACC2U704_9FUNG|nr:hypothetical protein DSO57_1002584 [Entomophthora muscae]
MQSVVGMTSGEEVDSRFEGSERDFKLSCIEHNQEIAFGMFEHGDEYKIYLSEEDGNAKWRIKDKKKETKYMVYYDDGHATLMAPKHRIASFPLEEDLSSLDSPIAIETAGSVSFSLEARSVAYWELTIHDKSNFCVYSLTRHQKGWDVSLGPLTSGSLMAKFRPRVGETKLGVFTFLVQMEPLVAQCLMMAFCHAVTVANARYQALTGERPYLEHDQYFKYFDPTPQLSH